ncbi:hypothetical protein ACHAXT_001855 [Thalassiosira profunda]
MAKMATKRAAAALLLCLATCQAAFGPGRAAAGPTAVAFVANPPRRRCDTSRAHQCSSPTLRAQLPPPLQSNDRFFLHLTSLRATPNDNSDEGPAETTPGVRSLVRRSVSHASSRVKRASQKVQRLVASEKVQGLVAPREVLKGGAPIAGVLTDAAANAAELAAEEVRAAAREVRKRTGGNDGKASAVRVEDRARVEADAAAALDAILLAKTSVADAFEVAEGALAAAEAEIARARSELGEARKDAGLGLAAVERVVADLAVRAERETEQAVQDVMGLEGLGTVDADAGEKVVASGLGDESSVIVAEEQGGVAAEQKETESAPAPVEDVEVEPSVDMTAEPTEAESEEEEEAEEAEALTASQRDFFDVSSLSYDDVDFTSTDMAAPFIGEDECLVPGEPLVRVEKAPQNSRRIFAGIDIPVSVDDVWELLTDYANLQRVVPNLVVNEVLQLYDGGDASVTADDSLSEPEQCRTIADEMKGAVLKQVGGAKVVGINFSARTTLEVREWPEGMPDFAHFEDEVYLGKSRAARVQESRGRELARYVFPRPFALSSLPHKDISMQSVEDDDGEFRMYQGVWRMQPLPGCSPPGESAMRLTYAVEVSPRPYLPVALVEGRIARDLCSNLEAIRDVFAARAEGR